MGLFESLLVLGANWKLTLEGVKRFNIDISPGEIFEGVGQVKVPDSKRTRLAEAIANPATGGQKKAAKGGKLVQHRTVASKVSHGMTGPDSGLN